MTAPKQCPWVERDIGGRQPLMAEVCAHSGLIRRADKPAQCSHCEKGRPPVRIGLRGVAA